MAYEWLGNVLGGLGGAALASHYAPKAPTYTPITKEQLDAATIPQMQTDATNRMSSLEARRSAEGGSTAGEMRQKAAFNQQLQSGIAQRQAMNVVAANQSANQIAAAQDAAKRQRFHDIIGGGITGSNMFGGAFKDGGNDGYTIAPNTYDWTNSSSYNPTVDFSNMGGSIHD